MLGNHRLVSVPQSKPEKYGLHYMRTHTQFFASTAVFLACMSLAAWTFVGFSTNYLPAQNPASKSVENIDFSGELPRIAPKSPAEELATFELVDGYKIELVAAEPLVVDPVAFAFDGRGRLFVAEMIDYSEQATEHLGKIVRLEDTDRDGKFDKRIVFAEKLSWPTALFPWKDTVIVAAPPLLTVFRDANDDGTSESHEVLSDSFSRANVQGLTNSFRWTVEGYIHAATSSSGGQFGPQDASQSPLVLRGRDYVIDPITRKVRAANGGGQHGMSFNRWGDKFVTSNSDHLQQVLDLDSWINAQKTSVPIPSLRRSIAEDGPQAEVYRRSPVEPWRIVRTRLRISGQVPGVVEGGGRAAGYFTGATGNWVLDSEAGFGDPQFDTAIVCDVGSNLVHRKRLIPQGLYFSGQRIDAQKEFLRSSDIWFRPVQIGDGPDGALYIADMYREVIEHPLSLPPVIKRHLDLTSGNDRGRIWRVVPVAQQNRKVDWSLAYLSNLELTRKLDHPVAWQRRMASQLLVERNSTDVATELTQLSTTSPKPESRILALHVLNRIGKLVPDTLAKLIGDKHARVQEHAIRVARMNGHSGQLATSLLSAATTADVHVQLELAMSATQLEIDQRMKLLRSFVASSRDPILRSVISVAAGDQSVQLIARQDTSPALDGDELSQWLTLLLPTWAQQVANSTGAAPEQLREAIVSGLTSNIASQKHAWLTALCNLPTARQTQPLLSLLAGAQHQELETYIEQSVSSAVDSLEKSAEDTKSIAKLAWLRLLPLQMRANWSDRTLKATFPTQAQSQVAESLLWADVRAGTEELIGRAQQMTPAVQQIVLSRLMRYSQSLNAVADAIEQKKIATSQIAPDVRRQLINAADAGLKERFTKLLDTASPDRQKVIDRYREKLAADAVTNVSAAARGRISFQRVCANCHRLADMGNDVGPPLKQLADKSPDQLLDTILDPNREVDPRFLGYSVLMSDGRVIAGIIQDESSSQIVLAESGGNKHTISRGDIERLQSTKMSLMPIGLEEQLTPEQLSDLIAFLKQVGQP